MGGYSFLQESYQVTEGTKASSGTKAFKVEAGGSDSLPDLGDSFDIDHLGVVAVTRVKVITFYDPVDTDNNGYTWTVNYSTTDPEESSPVNDTDCDQRTFSVGGEIFSVDSKNSNWGWSIGDVGEPPQPDSIKGQKLFFSNPIGLISYTKEIEEGSYEAFKAEVKLKAGKINKTDFENLGKGNVLFLGTNGSLQSKADGTRVWKFTLNFKWRSISDGITENAFQYLFSKDGNWEIPATSTAGDGSFVKNLYSTAEFNTGLIAPA